MLCIIVAVLTPAAELLGSGHTGDIKSTRLLLALFKFFLSKQRFHLQGKSRCPGPLYAHSSLDKRQGKYTDDHPAAADEESE